MMVVSAPGVQLSVLLCVRAERQKKMSLSAGVCGAESTQQRKPVAKVSLRSWTVLKIGVSKLIDPLLDEMTKKKEGASGKFALNL